MGSVGARVREIREAKGLSLEVVAAQINVTHSTLSRYECGKLKIDAELLPRLGEVMRVDPCEFLRRPAVDEAYLNQDVVASKWAERMLTLPDPQVQLLIDFLEFQRLRE